MKKVIVYCFALLLTMLVGCQKETLNIEEADIAKEPAITQKAGFPVPNRHANELIILYPEKTTEAEKIVKRAEYSVVDYKQCQCADPNLELWIFDDDDHNGSGSGGIEEKKATAKSDEEIEGAEYNPEIKIQENQFIDFSGVGYVDEGIIKRVPVNQGVTVAVLDTGIMYDYPDFTSPFLYNSSGDSCTSNGYQEQFGWNFVNQDNNPYDDHYGRHGTIVTKLIASKLEAANIDYQILPVKVANRYGNISYFDALCGFQYAANKADVDIINMSFGWNYAQHELLQYFIEEATDVLVVTSAGNKGQNNDITPHYPSSYESDNILAVAALSSYSSYINNAEVLAQGSFGGATNNSALANFSNRGVTSVDIAAPGEYIPFTYNNYVFYINGTSYSAALTTGFGGVLHADWMTGVALKNAIIQSSIHNPDLAEIQYSKHIPD